MTEHPAFELDERTRRLLRVLVAHYIRDGQPVGSRTLSRDSGLELSPATIRNIMADLEDLGFVSSPHTSAGRVPTIKGYRFFVDSLIKLTPPGPEELKRLESDLKVIGGDPQAVALSASNLISTVTRLAGIVTVPRRQQIKLSQIEFLPLADKRVLAIIVCNDREVQNRIVDVGREFTSDELRQASNYLTDEFCGKDLVQVRAELVRELSETRESMNAVMIDAIRMAQAAFPDTEPDAGYVMAGETNLMSFRDLGDVEQLRSLFEAFSRQRDVLHLLDQSLNADGVQIFIGQESGYDVFESCSIVSAPYGGDKDGSGAVGVIGVIGPTRMAYERVIPIVDITAKLLGRALNSVK